MERRAVIGVGVMGMGFMGRTHVRAYGAAAAAGLPCRLVAVASPDPRELAGEIGERGNLESGEGPLFDPGAVRVHADAAGLAADANVQLVSVCTPTDTHVELAKRFLRAGKDVVVEKPVALRAAEARELVQVAQETGRLCMPAMCMRFWPGWDWLKERVEDGSLGEVKSATFVRMGSRPTWAPEFYRDAKRCGGAIYDLHVHDLDVIYWLFGRPRALVSAGTIDHVTTLYEFGAGPRHVTAEGAWVESAGFPFRMRYTVEFEGAVADWDLTRQPQLLLTREGRTAAAPLRAGAGYEGEIRAAVQAVSTGRREGLPTLEEAVEVLEILEAECRSVAAGGARVEV